MERLKVLISAYACEPGKGSEPEVGWQWALQMARFHDVTVLTRANNEPAIAEALRRAPPAIAPRFAYFDLRTPFLRLKRKFGLHHAYYNLWQRSARRMIANLLKTERFDLLHHVTFAGARHPVAIFGHEVPSIYGPVGGLESIPLSLLPWRYPRPLVEETGRNLGNLWQRFGPGLRGRAAKATIVLASTEETRRIFARFGIESRVHPAIGLNLAEFSAPDRAPVGTSGPLRLLYVGRLLFWKGLDLALKALHESGVDANLTLIGDGEFRAATEKLARDLGLEKKVEFRGHLNRVEVLRANQDFDALLYPSLHDSGGFSLIEAMASGLPPICLDCAGPGYAVSAASGIKVPLGSKSEVIRGLAEAIQTYARDPGLRFEHGRNARERIRTEYGWERKAQVMNRLYFAAVGRDEIAAIGAD
jgi:glycosyltransferase involved in cell wall biosynthesis